jgi:hypothetical protein
MVAPRTLDNIYSTYHYIDINSSSDLLQERRTAVSMSLIYSHCRRC